MAKTLYQVGLFPLALAVYISLGAFAIQQGVDKALYSIAVYVSLIVLGLVFERFDPVLKSETEENRIGTDVFMTVFNAAVVAKVGGSIVSLFFVWLANNYFGGINWGPIWLQVILCVLIVEFVRYWVHRLQHEVPSLWKLHAIHHSVPKTYSLNGLFANPIDFLLRNVIPLFIPVMLGMNGDALFVATVVLTVAGFFTHCNLPLRYGFLEWFIASPRLHRWHHSMVMSESNANYGVGFILFDRIFRTLCDPKGRAYPEKLGIEGYNVHKGSVKSLVGQALTASEA